MNQIIEGQLDDLEGQLDGLSLFSGDAKEEAVKDLKDSLPRLANLANSDLLPQELVSRVLQLNDKITEYLNDTCGIDCNRKPMHNNNDSPTKSEKEIEGRLAAKDEFVYLDLVKIDNYYLRVLNHSSHVIDNLELATTNINHKIDFLPPAETWTIKLDSTPVNPIRLHYKSNDKLLTINLRI